MKGDERNEKFGFSHNSGTCSLLRNEAVQSRSGNKIEKGIYSDVPSVHYLAGSNRGLSVREYGRMCIWIKIKKVIHKG